jgi:hypothetical protein
MTSGQARFPIAPSMFKFTRYANNQDGVWISELMPHTGASPRALLRPLDAHRGDQPRAGITFFQTGNQQPGRPVVRRVGRATASGSANANLPTFVVLITQGFGNMQALAARFWGSGFLPSEHQGCKLRSAARSGALPEGPRGRVARGPAADARPGGALNEREAQRSARSRGAHAHRAGEMAYRMQMSVPELTDFSDEDEDDARSTAPR